MQPCYFDNAATAFPKAPGLGEAMSFAANSLAVNPGRSNSEQAAASAMVTLGLREDLCALLGGADPACCILTSGATFGLNMVLSGWCRAGDHVLVSSMEHNGVMRPLWRLESMGVELEIVPCAPDGTLDPRDVEKRLRKSTRLVFMTHASNVSGTVLPLYDVGQICKQQGVAFGVDAAQTAGHMPLSMKDMQADVLVVPAHKGLLGPAGMGAVLMTRDFAEKLPPLCVGGTGSESDKTFQPERLPDKFEAGTCNLPGIYGLAHSVRFLRQATVEAVHRRERRLFGQLLQGLECMPHLRVLGRPDLAVAAVDFTHMDNAQAAFTLEEQYQILTRCGLQCAPLAHQTLGTFPQGTVRFSLGYFNTPEQVEYVLDCVDKLKVTT